MPVYKIGERRETCEGCGACCQGWDITLLVEELDRVPEGYWGLSAGEGPLMLRVGGACMAFDPVTKRCTIYDRRPAACREFLLGGYECSRKAAELLE